MRRFPAHFWRALQRRVTAVFRRIVGFLAASFIFLTSYRRLQSFATRESIERRLQKRLQFSRRALRSRRQTAIIRRLCTRQWKNTNHIHTFSGRRRSLHKSSRGSHRRCAQEIFSFRPSHFEFRSRRPFSSHPGVFAGRVYARIHEVFCLQIMFISLCVCTQIRVL